MTNVSKSFALESGRELRAIENISLTLNEGEVLALLGPSGSGKSTCLRLMCGLFQPSTGKVQSRGTDLVGVNRDVAMVFQAFALLPWESVYQNISLALQPLALSKAEQHKRVSLAVDLVGLEGFEEAYPRELSGGMKQRVGLARALAMQRPILFLDEPFSALDVLTSETLRQEILKIFVGQQTTIRSIVLVTHNIHEAVLMADRILVLGSNPGHIRQEFRNQLLRPRDPDSREFNDMVSRIHGTIVESYMPDAPTEPTKSAPPAKGEKPRPEVLPRVSMIEVASLIELIYIDGGSTDLFALAEELRQEFGHALYLVKAAELLELVDTPKQQVVLTESGIRFATSDMNSRKRMMHESFGRLEIVKITTALLKTSGIIRVPVSEVIARIQELLPNQNAEQIVDTLINWGRFSEYFGYNDDTKSVYLDIGQDVHP